MTSAEVWRAHAKSAVTLLAELPSEEDRMRLLVLAQTWLRNAEALEWQGGRRHRAAGTAREKMQSEAGNSATIRS